MVRRFAILAICLAPQLALAMVGGAQAPDPTGARHVVLLVGSGGTACTGVAIASDLVLTAGHCVLPGADYKLMELAGGHPPQLHDVATISRHPQFELASLLAHRATADVALLKLTTPLPQGFAPAPLAAERTIAVGEAFVVAGYGVGTRGDPRSAGTLRASTLVATGQPGALQLRLFDPRTRGEAAGFGACTGDSGGPVFDPRDGRLAVIGVVSWSTGPKLSAGCGGLTGVTPLARYRAWIVDTAAKLGSVLVP